MLRALLPKKTKLSNYDSKINEYEVDVNSIEKMVESDNVDEVLDVM